jgi:hypothetical protein
VRAAGHADIEVVAEPVGALADDDGTVVGLSKRGMLVSMEPAEAVSVYTNRATDTGQPAPVDSHPIMWSQKSIANLSGELPEVTTKSLFARTLEHATVRMHFPEPATRTLSLDKCSRHVSPSVGVDHTMHAR